MPLGLFNIVKRNHYVKEGGQGGVSLSYSFNRIICDTKFASGCGGNLTLTSLLNMFA